MSAFVREIEVSHNLGTPLPAYDIHAVSVSLPLWEHVVGYEEGKPNVINNMITGYPRFRFHNTVQGLQLLFTTLYQWLKGDGSNSIIQVFGQEKQSLANKQVIERDSDYNSLILPTLAIARRLEAFLKFDNQREAGFGSHSVHLFAIPNSSKVVAIFRKEAALKAKRFWQHSGELLTSRQAERLLTTLLAQTDAITLTVLQKKSKDQNTSPFFLLTNLLALSSNEVAFGFSFASVEKIWTPLPSAETTDLYAELPYHLDDDVDLNSHLPIKKRISEVINYRSEGETAPYSPVKNEDIFLASTGMAAIFTAFRLIQQTYNQSLSTSGGEPPIFVVFGFLYLDTLKIMLRPEWNAGGVHFFGHGNDDDLEKLEKLLDANQLSNAPSSSPFKNRVAAIFSELPTNPLINCANVARLTTLAQHYGVSLVLDDTIGNFANLNLFSKPNVQADIVVSSLTKTFSGASNLMAGSLILNPNTSGIRYDALSQRLHQLNRENDLPYLPKYDAQALEYNSRSFLIRSSIVNKNGYTLAHWLSNHPYVKQAFHSSLNGNDVNYNVAKRGAIPFSVVEKTFSQPDGLYEELLTTSLQGVTSHEGGYGCLLSFEVKPEIDVKVFHDRLQFNKGPSLGTNFTLVSPYTMMAHYDELKWANGYGVPSHLLRVSIGLENINDIISRFDEAFQFAVAQAKLVK